MSKCEAVVANEALVASSAKEAVPEVVVACTAEKAFKTTPAFSANEAVVANEALIACST